MVKICPKCYSKDIIYAGETSSYAAFRTGQMYYCKNCEYVGSLILDLTKKGFKALKEQYKKG